MTELEVLARNIHALKELLRVAWRDLANAHLSSFERREARNQIKEYSAQLRCHFQLLEAERSRAPPGSVDPEHQRLRSRKADFRVLG
jgi:hypothetical protein